MCSRNQLRSGTILVIGLLIGISLINSSCDYKRNQTIPKDIEILSKTRICNFDNYQVFEYILNSATESSISEWQDGLVCEGYSNRPMSLPWTKFDQLSLANMANIEYFLENMDRHTDLDLLSQLTIDKNGFWAAACRTEWINEATGEKNSNYHVVYILDLNESILYEIRNID